MDGGFSVGVRTERKEYKCLLKSLCGLKGRLELAYLLLFCRCNTDVYCNWLCATALFQS